VKLEDHYLKACWQYFSVELQCRNYTLH